jgi:hypothetical protein
MTADGIRWIGAGGNDGMLGVQFLPRFSFGWNYQSVIFPPYITFRPKWRTTFGIQIPFVSKSAEVQFQSNQNPMNRTTGGYGDVSLDASRLFGVEGQHCVTVRLTVPTGKYNENRGSEYSLQVLPVFLQKGSGVYTAALTYELSRDLAKGLLLFEVGLNAPFNMKPISGRNEFLDGSLYRYIDRRNSKRFYYRFKTYGENDIGDYFPPSAQIAATFAYRGIPDYVHSLRFMFSAPFNVAWIHSEWLEFYNPRPDPDFKAWNCALSYGLEFSRLRYPLFFTFSLPIHDKPNLPGEDVFDPTPLKKWDLPEWADLGQQWTIGMGIKARIY